MHVPYEPGKVYTAEFRIEPPEVAHLRPWPRQLSGLAELASLAELAELASLDELASVAELASLAELTSLRQGSVSQSPCQHPRLYTQQQACGPSSSNKLTPCSLLPLSSQPPLPSTPSTPPSIAPSGSKGNSLMRSHHLVVMCSPVFALWFGVCVCAGVCVWELVF